MLLICFVFYSFFVTRSLDEIYDTNFLLSSQIDMNMNFWRNNDISIIYIKEGNIAVFYNFSSNYYQNNDPTNYSLSTFEVTNISNQDTFLYLLYDNQIQIYSYEILINDSQIRLILKKNVMTLVNQHYITFSNISDLIIFQLSSLSIQLYSDFHLIDSDSYFVFLNDLQSEQDVIQKIQLGATRLFIYFPIYVDNNFETLDIELKFLKNEINSHINEKAEKLTNDDLLVRSQNYSLYYYSQNSTITLKNNENLELLNYYEFNLSDPFTKIQGYFIDNLNSDDTLIDMAIMIDTILYFFSADFEKGFFHYLGRIYISSKFNFDEVINSPSDNIITAVLINKNYVNNYFFLKLKKDKIYTRTSFFECSICSYYNLYSCDDQNHDCSIILQNDASGESDPYFKVWLSVLVSVFGVIIIIIICCFMIQRFCFHSTKHKTQAQITNYDEVEERLKTLDKKKIEALMKKYSITIEETNMEKSDKLKPYMDNKCAICMELLPSQPITYFSCKAHIVHTKCLILYEEERRDHTYKCPFRCL